MNLLILLQDVVEGAPKGNPLMQWLPIVAIIAVFYFLMIRPQQKRQKEIKKQREAMQVGDKVVTSGGIYGKVKEIKDNAVIVEIAENVRIKVDKNYVFASAEDLQTQK
jgi:preprotein translocase, YajC subunit